MPGCWVPVVSNVLAEQGWEHLTDWVFIIPSLGAIISPLFLGALADQRFDAGRILAAVLAANAVTTALAFWFLKLGDSLYAQAAFLFCLSLKALLGAPSWTLLMAVTLTHLKDSERQFGGIRVWGTLGWMAAGWTVSLLALDESPMTGIMAAIAGLLAAGFSLTLPSTPPTGLKAKTMSEALGLKAFSIFKDRDTAVYFLTAFFVTIPLAAYYPYTAKFAKSLGIEQVAAFLSIGQTSEILAMLLMGWTFRRMRVKVIFLIALAAGTLRYGSYFFAAQASGESLSITPVVLTGFGILMHGICWTLFFECGRIFVDRRVEKQFRAQAQSLLTVFTTGLASIVGILVSGILYRWCVEGSGPGWEGFWLILTGCCLIGGTVFAIGYRGLPAVTEKV